MNKRFAALLPILGVLVIFAALVGGTVPYFLLYSFVFAVTLPLTISLFSLYYVKGTISIPPSSYKKGDLIPINYEVKNRTLFTMPYLELSNDAAKALSGKESKPLIISLKGRDSYTRREQITAFRRGYYSFGEISLNLRDAFGIFNIKKIIREHISILILPEVMEISTFRISASRESGELLITDLIYQDRSRISTLRDYREGDSSKVIHWRLSAAKDNPLVKEFENRGDADLAIFVENSKTLMNKDVDRRLEDLEVDLSLSIISCCLNHNVGVKLLLQDMNKHYEISGSHVNDMIYFLEAMARFSSNGESRLDLLIEDKSRELPKGANIIVITPVLDTSLGAKLLDLSSKGFNPSLIVVSDYRNKSGHLDESVEERIRQEGIQVLTVDCTFDSGKILEVGHG